MYIQIYPGPISRERGDGLADLAYDSRGPGYVSGYLSICFADNPSSFLLQFQTSMEGKDYFIHRVT